jgi:hypothetical protein
MPDGDYANPIDKCSGAYVSCSGAAPVYRQCSANLKFDSISNACLFAKYTEACGGKATTLAQPSYDQPMTALPSTRSPKTTEQLSYDQPMATLPSTRRPKTPTIRPTSTKQPSYDQPMTALPSTRFPKTTSSQATPTEAFTMSVLATTTNSTPGSMEKLKELCAAQPVAGFYNDPSDCSRFVFCGDDQPPVPLVCPVHAVFNPLKKRCESKDTLAGDCGSHPESELCLKTS